MPTQTDLVARLETELEQERRRRVEAEQARDAYLEALLAEIRRAQRPQEVRVTSAS